jgi:Co/Zn/Cd efflux system component
MDTRYRSQFAIPKMDCAAEEQLIRLALAKDDKVHRIAVDLAARQIAVTHASPVSSVEQVLSTLNLGAKLIDTAEVGVGVDDELDEAAQLETKTLRIVLAINAAMFFAEGIGALLADSAALLADSLDMFADAAVYGIALYGARRGLGGQATAARWSGYLQLALAVGAATELVRRTVFGSEPEAPYMIGIALLALAANIICMWLLARHRKGGAHMKASWIFTTNDVIANGGVMVAAGLVALTESAIPDLVVGALIVIVVFSGALRILRLPA